MEPSWFLDPSDRTANPILWAAIFLAFVPLLLVSCAPPERSGLAPGTPTETISQADSTLQPNINPNNSGTTVPTARAEDQDEDNLDRLYPTLPEGFERIERTQQAPVTGEVPASLLESILEDLSSRQGIDTQQIEVVRAEAVIWSDGSLGCPKLGEYYTQEPVRGYWIILEVGTTPYDYRASERGHFTLCERPLPQSLPEQSNK
jgi:hypothetical protein